LIQRVIQDAEYLVNGFPGLVPAIVDAIPYLHRGQYGTP
jgi:hypothetical protein